MERVFSDEEKIRRAIEISQRRNGYYNRNISVERVNVNEKKDYRLFKKMILQIIICLLIYTIFHLINTTNYAFSDDVIKNTNNILSYDINLEKLYTKENYQNPSIIIDTNHSNSNKNYLEQINIALDVINSMNKNPNQSLQHLFFLKSE